MRVNVYEEDTTTKACGPVELRDLFDPEYGEEDYHEAYEQIQKAGRAWVGGGSAPLYYATLAR